MNTLRILIVDNINENRNILKTICDEMGGFEVREAHDGMEAIENVEEWNPHIVLIDVMLPRMDGFEASKIIKERYPQTMIMAIAGKFDTNMEKNMASIGVAAYIHKPIDKKLIRFKLQNFSALCHSREGEYSEVSVKEALNPFRLDIRHFKTLFTIIDSEAMMDFGLWILARCDDMTTKSCLKVDLTVEFLYELMRQGIRNGESVSIIVEENFEEIFITMKFAQQVDLKSNGVILCKELGSQCIVKGNIACIRLRIHDKVMTKENTALKTTVQTEAVIKPQTVALTEEPIGETPLIVNSTMRTEENEAVKEIRVLQSNEQQMLRQSFVRKTSAIDYVQDIGGDVLDEIRDLESLDEEWIEKLHTLEAEQTVENIRAFTDSVLGVYVRAINNLFEFTALAYALSSLGSFLKEHSEVIVTEPSKLKTLVMLLEHLGADLTSWRDHIFGLQDTADIHYLDSSFFSSCMQIEQIIGNKEVASDDDDDGMEFF